jgi:hypothetical protein
VVEDANRSARRQWRAQAISVDRKATVANPCLQITKRKDELLNEASERIHETKNNYHPLVRAFPPLRFHRIRG